MAGPEAQAIAVVLQATPSLEISPDRLGDY